MLARSIIPSALLLAGSALAQGVQSTTEVVTSSYPVFTSVDGSTSYAFSVTDSSYATPTTDAGAFTSTAAPVYTSVAVTSSVAPAYTSVECQCVCSAPVIGYPIASQPSFNGSDPITDSGAFTSSPAFTDSSVFTSDSPASTTSAIDSEATPCDDDATSQVNSQATQSFADPTTPITSQTTQSDAVPTTQSVDAGAQGVDQNQVLKANSAVKEIVPIQLTAVFTLIGLVGAGVTFL
ncbi:hypothetical protein FRC04_001034 [Tulasnella sp. 424]|nr:hypothetical protein FRC04_001034 [Tulasnella sp. 424]KAG8977942.1 hypothetical protein FRC05_000470 [Tulasnella sp. 425]